MLIEVDQGSWEQYLNIVNYLCLGKEAEVTLLSYKTKKEKLISRDHFLGLESYFTNVTVPVLALMLGTQEKINLGYFIKQPLKIMIEKGDNGKINSVLIQFENINKLIINFEKPRVYQHTLPKK